MLGQIVKLFHESDADGTAVQIYDVNQRAGESHIVIHNMDLI